VPDRPTWLHRIPEILEWLRTEEAPALLHRAFLEKRFHPWLDRIPHLLEILEAESAPPLTRPDRWLLAECLDSQAEIDSVLTHEAMLFLDGNSSTPLQLEAYLTRSFEEGYKIGQKPVTVEVSRGF
jgi:hypothetical protein